MTIRWPNGSNQRSEADVVLCSIERNGLLEIAWKLVLAGWSMGVRSIDGSTVARVDRRPWNYRAKYLLCGVQGQNGIILLIHR